MDKILLFFKNWMSQWHQCSFTEQGIEYSCCEQYMMAAKAKLFGDYNTCERIMNTSNPYLQKQLGRQVRNFKQETWDKSCQSIVYRANLLKFKQNPELAKKLIATGDLILAEASPYDKVWGIGLKASDPLAQDFNTWKGQNLLGIALMQVRDTLNEKT